MPTLRLLAAACWRVVGDVLVLHPTLLGMNQHNLTPALAEARAADVQRATHHSTATLPPRRHLHALALLGLIIAAVTAPTSAFAVPMQDAAAPADAKVGSVRPDDRRSVRYPSITFTNPLHRSRGSGAGAGLL